MNYLLSGRYMGRACIWRAQRRRDGLVCIWSSCQAQPTRNPSPNKIGTNSPMLSKIVRLLPAHPLVKPN
uniref:Uncharacterized protein n=1 Tax=Setaria italica TaxID=4555 RepID=K4AHN7_SETIT